MYTMWARVCCRAVDVLQCILPIVHNNGKPETVLRDHAGSYLVVGLFYFSVGFFPTLAHVIRDVPLKQNFLENFADGDVYAITTRVAVLTQLLTVYPLILGIIRQQFFGMLQMKKEPTQLHGFIVNVAVLGFATLVAIFFAKPASVLSYAGTICGSTYVVFLPIGVHFAALKKKGQLTKLNIFVHVVIGMIGITSFIIGQLI